MTERQRRGFFRTNRRLSSTRQGKVFIGITLALGFGVLNSGNNLLFLCLGLLLSIITVSGLLSEANIRDLRLDVRAEPLSFAGERAMIELVVTNENARRDVFSLVLNVRFIPKSSFRSSDIPVRLVAPVTMMHVPQGETRTIRAEIVFRERGDWLLDEATVDTEYPFGLFSKTRLYLPNVRVLVAPAPAKEMRAPHLPPTTHGEHVRQKPGHSIELYDLREAAPDEDIRNVAWVKSAARGQLVSIRRASDATDAAVFAVRGNAGDLAFERGLSEATALLIRRMRDGAPTGLALGEGVLSPGTGIAHERQMLLLLAKSEKGAGEAAAQKQRATVIWL